MIEPFDADNASTRLTADWLEFADTCKDRAADAATPKEALLWASLSAEAVWCDTGEGSGLTMKDIFHATGCTPHPPVGE